MFDVRVLIATVIAAVLSAASTAYSQEIETIGFMRDACKELTRKEPDSILKFGICAGFILGQRAWRDGACVVAERGEDMDFFTRLTARNTQGHSLQAVAQSFINWAEDHPEHWSLQLHVTVVSEDLWSEFPCEAQTRGACSRVLDRSDNDTLIVLS